MASEPSTLARSIIVRFCWVSLIISSSHSCIVTVLTLSAPTLGEHLGGGAASALYICWVISCVLAPYYMPIIGTTRRALLCGLCGNALYLSSFTIAVSDLCKSWSLAARYAVVIGGACVGGLANGPVFVSQAVYFANSATCLAAARADSDGGAGARALLSAIFACVFTGEEVLLKLLAGVTDDTTPIFFAYTTVAGVCFLVAICLLPEAPTLPGPTPRATPAGSSSASSSRSPSRSGGYSLATPPVSETNDENAPPRQGDAAAEATTTCDEADDDDDAEPPRPAGPPGALAVVRMLWREPIARLAVLYAVSFGYVGAFEGVIIATRGVAAGPLGESAVGPATAIVAGTAALSSVPLSYFSIHLHPRWGRALIAVLFGPLAYVALGLALVFTGSSDDGSQGQNGGSPIASHSWPPLAAVQVLLGLGRAAWESVSAAATVEFFGDRSPAELSTLMAARSMCNGLGAAIAFILVPDISSFVASFALVGIGGAAGIAFLCAAGLHHMRDLATDEEGGDGLEARLVSGRSSHAVGAAPLLMLGPGSVTRGTSFKLDAVAPMPTGLGYRRACSHHPAATPPQQTTSSPSQASPAASMRRAGSHG